MSRTIQGEWWLHDGSATFADGDVGDQNHLGVVWDHVYSKLRDEIADKGVGPALGEESDPGVTRAEILDWSDAEAKEVSLREPDLAERLYEDPYGYLQEHLDLTSEEWDILTADGDEHDARLWAMRELGWTRAVGGVLETYGLDGGKLKELYASLGDVHEEDDAVLMIEDRKTGKVYCDVPEGLLGDGSMAKLREYLCPHHTCEVSK